MLHMQATQDAKSDTPVAEPGGEGGDTPAERRCTYMDLALCLTSGLDDKALHVLITAALPPLQVCMISPDLTWLPCHY